MKSLFQISNSTSSTLTPSQMASTQGGKRFLGVFTSYGWSSPVVQDFLRQGSVACVGTNQAMKANLYQNSAGDTICVEW
jgi:hypothetical protein